MRSENYGYRCLPILVVLFRLFFVFFGVILSSFISHIACYVPFFNLQKHIRKKNENHLDMFFRTPLYVISTEFICIFGVLLSMPLWRFVLCFQR